MLQKNKKIDYIYSVELAFKIAFLLLTFATFNTFIYLSPVQPVLVKICLGLGGIALILRAIHFKEYIKMPYWFVLAGFIGSFLLSIFTNRQYGRMTDDLKWVIWTVFLFFLLYTVRQKTKEDSYKKEFTLIAHVFIGCSVIEAIWSLYLMFTYYSSFLTSESGEMLIAGFKWGRLWGAYTDPNYGAVVSVVAIFLCIYFFMQRKLPGKLLYGIAMLLNYVYIVFSDSRTAELTMIAGILSYIFVYQMVKRKGVKKILLSLLCGVLLSGVFLAGTTLLKLEYNVKIQKEVTRIEKENAKKNQKNKTNAEKKKEQMLGRKKDIENNISNGRLDLWKSGLEVWKTSPVLGTGYNSFIPYTKENVEDTYVVNNNQGEYVSLHNGYVNILVYQGILGFLLMLVFIGLAIRYYVKGFASIQKEDGGYLAVLTTGVVIVACSMMFLLEGVYTNSPGAFILWSFLGYLMHYFYSKKEEK
ncbi:multisubunit Na+/H+ antiporter MnhE subunit [Aequitasia blattaphilus]|uniref:O-antigen ligase family protein n=1 Tax=Aequitasia blattaphilus TaxID=2949332 RepID=A0ABT1E687_9FIRM|nr:O-antigen ligase family protein [Aequitasia blattaphilus]MCP1101268.1 O-antigen ligase family protein [Aequitasia blattaphilus]MCR8613908.1 O-antigen ligase family protein [Aequitasia blattaphilus]